MKKLKRRDLLKGSGLLTLGSSAFSNPLSLLMNTIVNGAIGKAHAQEAGGNHRKFLYVQLAGAPSRWAFTPLNPDPLDFGKVVKNPSLGNYFTGGSPYTDHIYKSVRINGLDMPYIWGQQVAKAGGGFRPMSDLMDHMLMIRGIRTFGGHTTTQHLRFHPLSMRYSLVP